jgi:DNA polymerase-1
VDENLPANETVMLGLYTDMPYYEEGIKNASQNKHHMELAPSEMLWDYASSDADGLARLIPPLLRRLERQGLMWVYDNISIPMVRATWAMTKRGIPIDMEYFGRLCERYRQLVADAKVQIAEAAGDVAPFNPNKPVDLQRVLFTDLGLPQSGRKTQAAKACFDCDKGECEKHDSTGKDALLDIKQMFLNKQEDPPPILDAILNYKTVSKRKSVYVDGGTGDKGMLQFIRPDDSVHPEYGVNKADTGRLSATKPPIQTIPKKVGDVVLGEKDTLRRIFVAPPGCFLLEADWNQGEVWVMAYESGDPKLLELLLSGQDVHTYVARSLCRFGTNRVFPKDAEEPELSDRDWAAKYDTLRTKAKVFVFGLDYGMTEVGAAQRLGCSEEEAAKLIEMFLSEVFPGLRAHFDKVRKQMEQDGYLVNMFGRRGHFGDAKFIKQWGRRGNQDWEALFRKGVNMPIQSGLNDLHMIAQIAVENEERLRARYAIILAVHDSITGKTPNDDIEFTVDTAWMIKEKMEDRARHLVLPSGKKLDWGVPVELKWGRSWGRLDWTLTPSGEVIAPKE